MERLLTLREAAPMLGYKLSYLRQIVTDAARAERRLPTTVHMSVPRFTRHGRRWKIRESDLQRWLDLHVPSFNR
jgi:hypothetical protein